MTHTYCAFGKCSTCSMLHSLHKCEISSKFSNLLHFTNKITHLRIHRTENAMRNYYNYVFSHTTRVSLGMSLEPLGEPAAIDDFIEKPWRSEKKLSDLSTSILNSYVTHCV